jgi:hypothetical protein
MRLDAGCWMLDAGCWMPFIKYSFSGRGFFVTFLSKFSDMKKIIVGVVLLGSITAVAASLGTSKKKETARTEKKTEKKDRECKHSCPFSE